jgi:Fe-S cluster biogenesis protein NfuA
MPETSPLVGSDIDDAVSAVDDGAVDRGAGAAPASSVTGGEFYDKVAQVVKVIRPAIQADQGDIFLRGVDEATGIVSVELVGACIDCPASSQTLKQGLERILKQRVDGVTEVRHVGEELAGFDGGTRVSL